MPLVVAAEQLMKYPDLASYLAGQKTFKESFSARLIHTKKYAVQFFDEESNIIPHDLPGVCTLVEVLSLYGKYDDLKALKIRTIVSSCTIKTALYLAAINNHENIIKYFSEQFPLDHFRFAVKQRECEVIQHIVAHNNVSLLEHIEKLCGRETLYNKKSIFQIILIAMRCGYVNILSHYQNLITPQLILEAISKLKITLFSNGQVQVLTYAQQHIDEHDYHEFIRDSDSAMHYALSHGQVGVLMHYGDVLGEKALKGLLRTHSQYAAAAIKSGAVTTIKYIQEKMSPHVFSRGLAADDYLCVMEAARAGHMAALQHLEPVLSLPEHKNATISKPKGLAPAVVAAHVAGHKNIVMYFLARYPAALGYMESHVREYSQTYVYPYIHDYILALQKRQVDFQAEQPNGVFDISEAEKLSCLYMIRHLIRRGIQNGRPTIDQAALMDKIRFLVSMPSVRAGLSHALSDVPNELLQLAIRIGHEPAMQLLLGNPEVYRLMAQNAFYRDLTRGAIDLRRLAQDAESSMIALSQSEERQLKKVRAHYQTQINEMGGLRGVLSAFIADLRARYIKNPATIEVFDSHGVSHQKALPFTGEAWSKMKSGLSEKAIAQAESAYFNHEVHSAYRYFLKPNPWMHNQASYVYVLYDSMDNTTILGTYSTFEEYLPIIAPFYLAANDKSIGTLEGYTPEDRANLFIREIALIARAHNWDQSRLTGKVDKHGCPISEEFDDGQADRPSCYSGVKRRLFQAVLGHPLLIKLTRDIVHQALREQVRDYYVRSLAEMCPVTLSPYKVAFDAMVEGEPTDITIFRALDIPKETKYDMGERIVAQFSQSYRRYLDNQEWTIFETMMRDAITFRYQACDQAGGDFLSFATTVSDLLDDAVSPVPAVQFTIAGAADAAVPEVKPDAPGEPQKNSL